MYTNYDHISFVQKCTTYALQTAFMFTILEHKLHITHERLDNHLLMNPQPQA